MLPAASGNGAALGCFLQGGACLVRPSKHSPCAAVNLCEPVAGPLLLLCPALSPVLKLVTVILQKGSRPRVLVIVLPDSEIPI